MPFILALDQGTTSSRAMLFDSEGAIRGIGQREFAQSYPQPGWVEHDPHEIWKTQLWSAQRALEVAGVAARDVTAIGITNQRETTVVWDRRSGEPVYPAIVWQDRRTAGACERLSREGYDELVARKTGLRLDPYFSATKIAWILDNVAGARERAERGELAFGTIDTWLIWNLTGGRVHATDYTNASRTLLFDINAPGWDDELLRIFGVPRAILPECRPCVAAFGMTEAALLGAALPIRGVAGDQQAALIGQGGEREGLAKNTYGTGSFLMLDTGTRIARSTSGLLTTVACSREEGAATYALEGSIFVTGAAVQWLRDGLGIIEASGDVELLAARVEDSGGVYFVPAFAGLGAPYWDPHARGLICGLTRGTTRAHIARATLEAIAYQTCDVVRAMERDAGKPLQELRVDGGAAVNDLLMQFQADILGIDVVRPRITETTALGAAYLAGLDASTWREERRFRPAMDAARREELLAGWKRAVERARGDA